MRCNTEREQEAAERTALIAKRNTLIRERYPHTHALYLRCEKSCFGVFWDKACQARRAQGAPPLPLHICMDAAETACRVSGEEHDALSRRLKEVIEQARRTMARRPRRNRRGDIIWPKMLPFASITLRRRLPVELSNRVLCMAV